MTPSPRFHGLGGGDLNDSNQARALPTLQFIVFNSAAVNAYRAGLQKRRKGATLLAINLPYCRFLGAPHICTPCRARPSACARICCVDHFASALRLGEKLIYAATLREKCPRIGRWMRNRVIRGCIKCLPSPVPRREAFTQRYRPCTMQTPRPSRSNHLSPLPIGRSSVERSGAG